jgi:cell fate regulator YaaT (PSP1 superfamily)
MILKNIVGVKFKKEGKIYSFDAADLPLKKNDQVIVNTEDGPAIGIVITDITPVDPDKMTPNLKNVLRKITEEDLKIRQTNCEVERQAYMFCMHRIQDRTLPMKLIDVESQ